MILTDCYSILQIKKNMKSNDLALSNLNIHYTWKDIKKSYENNEIEISARTWKEEFKLPDG